MSPNHTTIDQAVHRSESQRPRTWADAEEVALALGISAHTLRRLARGGNSPVVVRRVGGQWRWSRADLDRFVNGDVEAHEST